VSEPPPESGSQLALERQEVIRRRAMLERQLTLAIAASCAYFVLVGAGALVVILLLLDDTHSDELTEVARLSLAGGALGATVRALYQVMDSLERGIWELADGTLVDRKLRRQGQARKLYLLERPAETRTAGIDDADQIRRQADEQLAVHPRSLARMSKTELAELAAQEQERAALGLSHSEYQAMREVETRAGQSWGFSLYDLPLLILLPLLGAALGLVAFAGLVGGFLVASGSRSPSYSPAGLLFVAALAGMFAPNFIAALSRAADAIFGKAGEPPAAGQASAVPLLEPPRSSGPVPTEAPPAPEPPRPDVPE
jgi:hypothetical protein